MELSGKAEKEFKEWYENPKREAWAILRSYKYFLTLPESMQWGVYVDFFDWVGVYISLESESPSRFKIDVWSSEIIEEFDDLESREEARIKAIELANEIYNNC